MDQKVFLRGNGNFTETEYQTVLRQDDEQHLMLALGLTTRPGCNLSCIYCYTGGGESNKPKSHWMTKEGYRNAIHQAASLGAKTVVIDGIGEPLKDPLVDTIIGEIAVQGMVPFLATNITDGVDSRRAKFLYETGTSLFVSLDSIREDTYARIVQREGMLKPTLAGIDHCLAAGYGGTKTEGGFNVTNIALNTMVMDLNLAEIPEIESFCQERGILFTARVPGRLGSANHHWETILGGDGSREKLDQVAKRYSGGEEIFSTTKGCLFWVAGVILDLDGRARICYGRDNQKEIGDFPNQSIADLIRSRNRVYPLRSNTSFCPLHDERLGTLFTPERGRGN